MGRGASGRHVDATTDNHLSDKFAVQARRSRSGPRVGGRLATAPPDVLAEIVSDAIEARIDYDAYAAVLAREQIVRDMTRDEIIELIQRVMDD